MCRDRRQIVPVLEAAHTALSPPRARTASITGLLLRSDLHTLFDRGYLAVHPHRKTLLVSPRLRAEWGNGEEFYARVTSGQAISVPARRAAWPNGEFLTWHADRFFS
jgi:putative restriction endonuclease